MNVTLVMTPRSRRLFKDKEKRYIPKYAHGTEDAAEWRGETTTESHDQVTAQAKRKADGNLTGTVEDKNATTNGADSEKNNEVLYETQMVEKFRKVTDQRSDYHPR